MNRFSSSNFALYLLIVTASSLAGCSSKTVGPTTSGGNSTEDDNAIGDILGTGDDDGDVPTAEEEADPLFATTAAGRASDDAIPGLWRGSKIVGTTGVDVRVRFAPTSATFGVRCMGGEDKTAKVTVKARISEDRIEILESKESGSGACVARATAATFRRCADLFDDRNCFSHQGAQMTLHGNEGESPEMLTKIAD